MKKNVLVFGAIAGFIASAWAICSIGYCHGQGTYEGSMLLGFASMIIAFSFMYVGIKNYRDKYNGGVISFGKALQMGALIALIGSSIYVVAWMIDYYFFIPDFMEKFSAHEISKIRAAGGPDMAKDIENINQMKETYKSPFGVIMYTYVEILPLALIIALITALILKRKHPAPNLATA